MTKIKGKFANTYDSFIKRQSFLPAGLRELALSANPKSIVDFGCGTGNIAIGFSLDGFDVTGVDYSPEMLMIARQKAREYNADVKFINGDIGKIALKRVFNLLLCTGNTMALIHSESSLKRFLSNCRRHLEPGGRIIFQLLNYDRMLKAGSGTFAIENGNDGVLRIKQNKYGKNRSEFFVTIVDSRTVPPKISTNRGIIRPWRKAELTGALRSVGFDRIRALGSYDGEPFNLKSKDLIIVAKRGKRIK